MTWSIQPPGFQEQFFTSSSHLRDSKDLSFGPTSKLFGMLQGAFPKGPQPTSSTTSCHQLSHIAATLDFFTAQ